MMRVRKPLVDVAVGVAIAGLLVAALAAAHGAGQKFPMVWKPAVAPSVPWQFTSGVPTTNGWRERIKEGDERWNELVGSMQFSKQAGDANNYPSSNCPTNAYKNVVHRSALGGDLLGQVALCKFSDNSGLYSFHMTFDDDQPWYKDTGSPASNQFDLLSVAVHEFGHAAGGWTESFGGTGHFAEGSLECPVNTGRHTMCPSTYDGTTWQRSLEEHDRHTFNDAY